MKDPPSDGGYRLFEGVPRFAEPNDTLRVPQHLAPCFDASEIDLRMINVRLAVTAEYRRRCSPCLLFCREIQKTSQLTTGRASAGVRQQSGGRSTGPVIPVLVV